ncbi:ATP-binding protein, partial [Paracraurococcus ruber]
GGRDGGPLCILAGQDGLVAGERVLDLPLPAPEPAERQGLWRRHVPDAALAAELAGAVRLGGADLAAVAGAARLLAMRRGEALDRTHVAAARQRLGADRLGQLAQPVRRLVDGRALVLAPGLREELDALVRRCRRREALWDGLGETLSATRSAGVRALFAGESGTGKTLAASYLATALGAPLWRCDIAAVMNKYVGESEKNLGALLEEAEARDVVLLFDEADALFGRRSEGKESGERYANMLTNFLLTRIEAHAGIVVLTTNSRLRLDGAFMRRLDMVLTFPAASFAERLALWRSHLGARAPGEEALRLLAGWCEFSGGSIRNVVLAGAALAEDGAPIGLPALLPGLEREYRKLGRAMPAELERLALDGTAPRRDGPPDAPPAMTEGAA